MYLRLNVVKTISSVHLFSGELPFIAAGSKDCTSLFALGNTLYDSQNIIKNFA